MPEPARWRLILDGGRPGAWNMALDEAIAGAVADRQSPATLRFYMWQPACLSIGYAQKVAEFDLGLLTERGLGFVRRPSGGRAVLHSQELTYCLCAPEDDPRMSGGVLESYRRLSDGFLEGLRLLGAQSALIAGQEAEKAASAACFDAPARYELTATGRKVIGSAQWRHRGAVLQHGSVPLYGDVAEVVEYLALSADERQKARDVLYRRAATLAGALGRRVVFEEAAQALAAGIAAKLDIEWQVGSLSEAELAAAGRMANEKYGSESWNQRN